MILASRLGIEFVCYNSDRLAFMSNRHAPIDLRVVPLRHQPFITPAVKRIGKAMLLGDALAAEHLAQIL